MKVTQQLRNSVRRVLEINDEMRTGTPASAIEGFLWFLLVMAMAGGLTMCVIKFFDSLA